MSVLQFLSSLGAGASCAQLAGARDFPPGRTGWRLQVPVSKTSAASGQEDRAPQGVVFVSACCPSAGFDFFQVGS